ncbi:hypothetical protein C8R44DRAFT_734409 [Mycena epipterygia]|nr:hypothetical protein C8R44DRAFT_734409 [Mycena epipterygia]
MPEDLKIFRDFTQDSKTSRLQHSASTKPEDLSGRLFKIQNLKTLKTSRHTQKTSVGDCSRPQDAVPKTPRRPQWETAQNFKAFSRPQDFNTGCLRPQAKTPKTPRRPRWETVQDSRPQDPQDFKTRPRRRSQDLKIFETLKTTRPQDFKLLKTTTPQDFKTHA